MDIDEFKQHLVVDVDFDCLYCNSHIQATINAPSPNYSAETNEDSCVEDIDYVICKNCDHSHEIIICNSMYSIYCSFTEHNQNINCSHPYYTIDESDELNWLIQNGGQPEIFYSQLKVVEKIQNEIQNLSPALQNSLNCMAFAHIVAATEGYLSSIFIHTVLNSKPLFNKLCMTDPDLKVIKFPIKSLVENDHFVENYVTDHLNKIIFHNVAKIKKMFKDVLDHDFGDIGWFGKAVSIRHDCVHRAGMKKDGGVVSIDTDEIFELIYQCKELATNLQISLSKQPVDETEPFDFDS